MIDAKDRKIIRDLATKCLDFASQPVIEERKRGWKAVHDLKAERPVILIETSPIDGFVLTSELLCQDPFLILYLRPFLSLCQGPFPDLGSRLAVQTADTCGQNLDLLYLEVNSRLFLSALLSFLQALLAVHRSELP